MKIENINERAENQKLRLHAEKLFKESIEKFDFLKIDADKIISINGKIIFWAKEKELFLRNLTMLDLNSSGHTGESSKLVGKELFLDRLISQEIDYLKILLQYGNDGSSAMEYSKEVVWENKTELSELIYALYHSKRIKINGKPIEQKELTEILCKLFNVEIKTPTDLLNKSATTFKRGEDGNTFINELNTILNNYIEKVRDKK